jgi:hypothetical protein
MQRLGYTLYFFKGRVRVHSCIFLEIEDYPQPLYRKDAYVFFIILFKKGWTKIIHQKT